MTVQDLLELTPVETRSGMFFKRDDFFRPIPGVDVNGGKLRQCLAILLTRQPRHAVTYASIYSPQPLYVAACGAHLGIDTTVFVGGYATPPGLAATLRMGAAVRREVCARHNALLAAARSFSRRIDGILIRHGMEDDEDFVPQLEIASRQVQNVPDAVETIVVASGSGLTATAVLFGIHRFKKPVRRLLLIGTGPRRLGSITARLQLLLPPSTLRSSGLPVVQEDCLPELTRFRYERSEPYRLFGIDFHPQYEAKAVRWAMENRMIRPRTLFWITGAMPFVEGGC